MKTTSLAVLVLALVTPDTFAAEGTREALQKGLIEEEVNRNLNAAIQAYEAGLKQFDEDRRTAATTIYRLGECYLKVGRTNDAHAQFRRVLREFSDQTNFVSLSQKHVSQEAAKATYQTRLQSIVKRAEQAEPAGEAEAKEIQRLQDLMRNSPDLINGRAPNGDTPLHSAVQKGQGAVVEFLLEHGADLNARTFGSRAGRTALHVAANEGHKTIVEMLLVRGADVNAIDKGNSTPLHYAAQMGYRTIVQVLLSAKAGINTRDKEGCTPLHLALSDPHQGVLQLLLANGADVNAPDNSGGTPLLRAVEAKSAEAVNLLLANQASANPPNSIGPTPLTRSIEHGTRAITDILLEHQADPNVKAIQDNEANALPLGGNQSRPVLFAPLHYAARTGDAALILRLVSAHADLDLQDDLGRTPLLLAITAQSDPAATQLLVSGANPSLADSNGQTPLVRALSLGQKKLLQKLLEKGANPNVGGERVLPPLHLAVYDGQPDIVAVLLENRADPNFKASKWHTALHYAAGKGDTNLMSLLLNKGADINPRDELGNTPLHYAAFNARKDAVQLLLDRGAAIEPANEQGLIPAQMMKESPYAVQPGGGIPAFTPGTVYQHQLRAREKEVLKLLQVPGAK